MARSSEEIFDWRALTIASIHTAWSPGGAPDNRPTAVQSFRAAVRFVCGGAQDAASRATAKTASLPSCARILTAISLPGDSQLSITETVPDADRLHTSAGGDSRRPGANVGANRMNDLAELRLPGPPRMPWSGIACWAGRL